MSTMKSKLAVASATLVTLLSSSAFAQAAGAASNASDVQAAAAHGAGFAIAIAALGGTLGQSRAAASALEGIARNPGAASKIQTPMVLGLALIESIVLFAFIIAIYLASKVG